MKTQKIIRNILVIVGLAILLITLADYAERSRSDDVFIQRLQIFSDFIEGKDVPLIESRWMEQGFGRKEDIRKYCKALGVENHIDEIWEKINSPQNFSLRLTVEPINLKKLRDSR